MASDRLLELSMLAAYLALLLWIGLRSARRIKTSDDYTLAGRGVGWVIVLATTAVTMIGGGASVGMASQVFAVGIAAALVTCAWHLQLIFTGLFVAPKLRGLNLITVGDYFHLKFGPLARELAVINCMIFLVGVLAAQLAAIGTVTNTILGIPYGTGLLIGAAVTIFYATVGGVRAVVNTDVLQFVILVAGFGVASSLLLVQHGGFEAMLAAADPGQAGVTSHWSTTRLLTEKQYRRGSAPLAQPGGPEVRRAVIACPPAAKSSARHGSPDLRPQRHRASVGGGQEWRRAQAAADAAAERMPGR